MAKLDKEVEADIRAHKPVAILGTIKECNVQLNRSDGVFNVDLTELGVVLSDAKAYLPANAPKLASSGPSSQPAASQHATSQLAD